MFNFKVESSVGNHRREGVGLSKEEMGGEWPGALLARRTGEGMEPDDLLCSRNARSRTPLVGRAQWKINQPPSLERKTSKLGGSIHIRPMRAVKGSLGPSFQERRGEFKGFHSTRGEFTGNSVGSLLDLAS